MPEGRRSGEGGPVGQVGEDGRKPAPTPRLLPCRRSSPAGRQSNGDRPPPCPGGPVRSLRGGPAVFFGAGRREDFPATAAPGRQRGSWQAEGSRETHPRHNLKSK